MSILCVGEMVADIVVRTVPRKKHLPDSVLVDIIDIVNGGDALNTAVGLGRLGYDVKFIGCAGNDTFAHQLVDTAKDAGVDVGDVRFSTDQGSSKVIALIYKDGTRSFLHCPGSNQQFCLEDIPVEAMRTSRHFHIGGTFHLPAFDGEAAAQALRKAKELGLRTSMDVAYDHSGRWLKTIGCCMPYLDYFLPSLEEAEEMLRINVLSEMAQAFKSLGVRNVIIKMGEEGVFCSPEIGQAFTCGCYRVNTVDTTGAGDAFVGGFLGAMDSGEPLLECILHGAANAAFAVQKVGATAGIRPMKILQEFLQTTKRPVIKYE